HRVQALRRERGLRRLVAGAVEADDEAVADELVAAHALDAGDFLDAHRGAGGRRPPQRCAGGGEGGADEPAQPAFGELSHGRAQTGMTLRKTRPSQPIAWASDCAPRPRCSSRTLAICALGTLLPGWIARGSTWPEKRSTS